MKKIIVISAAMSALLSCKKDVSESATPAAPLQKKVVEYRNVTFPDDNSTYTYDAYGKLILVENATTKREFTHEPGKIIIRSVKKSTGTLTSITEHELDAEGRAIKTVGKSHNGGVSYTRTHPYDAKGYLVKAVTENTGGSLQENIFTITNGNTTKDVYSENGVLVDVTDFFYHLDIPSKKYESMLSAWFIDNLFGKNNANEIKGYKRYNASGTLTSEKTTTILLDANGYVTKRSDYIPATNKTYDYLYFYQ